MVYATVMKGMNKLTVKIDNKPRTRLCILCKKHRVTNHHFYCNKCSAKRLLKW
jgi:hypothetical protein